MDADFIVSQLETNRRIVEAMVRGMPEPLRRWRPAPEHWCVLEIVCHLRDEEREDFRARLASVLDDPSKPLPRIDPQSWVAERRYMEQDLDRALDDFLAARDESIAWLRSLRAPRWMNAFQHPRFGPLTARMFLSNWLAHDLLHLRQITKRRYEFLREHAQESLEYAGAW